MEGFVKMREYSKNLQFFKSIFKRVQNFLVNKNIRVELFGDSEFLFLCDVAYEQNISFFSTRNENLMDDIVDYLNAEGYNVSVNFSRADRFVIVNKDGEVSVLDTGHDLVEEEGNLLLFAMDYVNKGDANYLAYELEPIVRLLNEMDKELKSDGL